MIPKDDFWMYELWAWADKNEVPDLYWVEDERLEESGYWKGLPKDKGKLTNLTLLGLSSNELNSLTFLNLRSNQLTQLEKDKVKRLLPNCEVKF